jgi:protein involved in polysaccharide export with SLBB domain
MHGKLRNLRWGLLLASCLAPGCALVPGRSLATPGNGLLDCVKDVRQPEPADLPRELDKHILPPYVVEPGDVLLVHPMDLDSPVRLPGDQPVLPDGTINLGKYGHLVVSGHTIEEIQALVQATVAAQVRNAGFICVRLITRQSKVYYVLGEVNAPGAYPLQGRETVLDGILTAGGLTDKASRKNIILTRPTAPNCGRIVLPICLREIVQLGDTTTNYQLAPGDRIFVSCRSCWEDGCFRQQDCFSCGGPALRGTPVPVCGDEKTTVTHSETIPARSASEAR